METTAKLTSKGQVTIPKAVREALGVSEGDVLIFRVEQGRASIARSRQLLDLAGAVRVPAAVRSLSWDEVRSRAWRDRVDDVER